MFLQSDFTREASSVPTSGISLNINVETAFSPRILKYIKSKEFLGKFVHACALYTRLSFGAAHAMEDSLGMRLTMSVHARV